GQHVARRNRERGAGPRANVFDVDRPLAPLCGPASAVAGTTRGGRNRDRSRSRLTASSALDELSILSICADEGGDEWTGRDHRELIVERVLQRVLRQLRGDALAAKRRRHERMVVFER